MSSVKIDRVRTLLSFSNFMSFLDLIKFYMTLGLAAVTFKNFQNFPRFKVFFDLKR